YLRLRVHNAQPRTFRGSADQGVGEWNSMSRGVQSEIFPAFALKMVVPELPAVTCSPSNNRLPDTVRSVSRSSRYIYQHIATCAEYACQQHFWYRNRIDDGERLLESGSIARHKFHQRELALIAHLVREGDD